MNQVNCPICGKKCVKSGKTNAAPNAGFVRFVNPLLHTSLIITQRN